MTQTRYPETAMRILRYFVRNPEAADTCEGIARWRLLEETIHHTTEETARAVDWLEARGYLQRVPGIGSSPLFMLDRAKLTEVTSFLAESEPGIIPMPLGKSGS
jgi:hypothetical protein